jgi:hypothetical protein
MIGMDEIYNLMTEKNRSSNKDEFIHLIWYCINYSSLRIDSNEVRIIKKII